MELKDLKTFEVKPSCKMLYKDGLIEIRKYPPCCRTLETHLFNKKMSFLVPLPYIVYFGVCVESGYKAFSLAFAKEEDEFVYANPWYATGRMICVDGKFHFIFPEKKDLSEIIARFWSTSFSEYAFPNLRSVFGISSLREWGKLSKDWVVEELHYGKHSLGDAIQLCQKGVLEIERWFRATLTFMDFDDEMGFRARKPKI